jgi:catechol-2,3-dioxygenase
MTNPRVIGVRSIELGVRNLAKSAQFYRDVWGLTEVSAEAGIVYLRGTGVEHHVLTLREQPETRLIAVHMAAPDRIDELIGREKQARNHRSC